MRPDASEMAKLPYTEVAGWLVTNGYCSQSQDRRSHQKKGTAIGISWERRHSDSGDEDYMVALYNVAAQQFIVDSLGEIMAFIQQKAK